MEQEPDDFDVEDDDDEDEEDDPFYPKHCLKVVLRSGYETTLNIARPKDAKRIWRLLMDDDRTFDHLEFSTNRNHIWIRLEHVLFAELIDDPTRDEEVVVKGARVRYITGLERTVDLPMYDPDDDWEMRPGEALGFSLSFTNTSKSVAYETDDATTILINVEAAELIMWGREEALPDFDAEEWATLTAKRAKMSAETREHIDELATKRPPPTKRKPVRRRRPARFR